MAHASHLTCLGVEFSVELPACLSTLTWLRALELIGTPMETDSPADWSHLLASAIAPLAQLAHLFIQPTQDIPADPQPVLAAAAALGHMHSFGWLGGLPDAQEALPPGPWLTSLRHLILPPRVAAASTGQLMQAGQLERLGAGGRGSVSSAQPHLQLLEWAPQHPTLRTLGVHLGFPEVKCSCRRDARDAPPAEGYAQQLAAL